MAFEVIQRDLLNMVVLHFVNNTGVYLLFNCYSNNFRYTTVLDSYDRVMCLQCLFTSMELNPHTILWKRLCSLESWGQTRLEIVIGTKSDLKSDLDL